VGEIVKVPSAFETEETPPEERHEPRTHTQPASIRIPFANVEEAVPFTSSVRVVSTPPANVDVAESPRMVVVAELPTSATFARESREPVAFVNEERPVTESAPEDVREVKEPAPPVIASAPTSIAPKPFVMEPAFKAPTDVSDDETTAAPKAVAERTGVLLMR
jgi:hypothetical protein